MCVILYYTCQNCQEETGQRDYMRHTDGQRFAIPDPEMEVFTFCPEIRARHMPIYDPLLQSPEFPCMSPTCAGLKVQFDVNMSQKQEDKILDLLSDTDYKVTLGGMSYADVKEMLKCKGIDLKTDMWKLPGAKLQKWNLYTEDQLKKMTAKGASYNKIKAALKAITGLGYTNYQIITKAASFDLYRSLFSKDLVKSSKMKQGASE